MSRVRGRRSKNGGEADPTAQTKTYSYPEETAPPNCCAPRLRYGCGQQHRFNALPHLDITASHEYVNDVRTTVDLDEDLLRVAKDLAREREQSLGRVLSDLAKRGLKTARTFPVVNGQIPILARKPGAQAVTSQHVRELLESEE